MSIKARNLSIVLAAVLIVLALVAGPRMAGSASPLSAPAEGSGEEATVPYYGQLNDDNRRGGGRRPVRFPLHAVRGRNGR